MKDWLGNEYDVGDKIIYAASYGQNGHKMVIAEMVKFGVGTVTVRPLRDSRSGERFQHGYVNDANGQPIDPYSKANWDNEAVWDLVRSMDGVKRRTLKPHIKPVKLPAKPVALKITGNITRWYDLTWLRA